MKKIIHPKSEESGISMLTDKDLMVFSPGLDGTCHAEIRMAQLNRSRKIFATSVEQDIIESAGKHIAEAGVSKQIKIKLEDLTKPSPYKDNFFDFIYAINVLHCLSKQKLETTIRNFFLSTKLGGHLFVVVRSTKDWEANLENSIFNKITNQTTYPILDAEGKPEDGKTATKYFHSIDSISEPIKNVGYTIKYVREYEEQHYKEFSEDKPLFKPSTVIEIFAKK